MERTILKKYFNKYILGDIYGLKEKLKSSLFSLDDKDELYNPVNIDIYENIVFDLERLAYSLRALIHDMEKESSNAIGYTSLKNYPVNIIKDENALIIKTPLTIKRRDSDSKKVLKENYMLMSYVDTSIKIWKDKNPDQFLYYRELFSNRDDLVFIVRRKAIKYVKSIHCDNDNLENGKIQNVIADALSFSDMCKMLTLVSSFKEVTDIKDIGTEFIITDKTFMYEYI